jgi:hypothetical protein
MNADEKKQFVKELAEELMKTIIRDIEAGKVPEDWDGVELRWLLSDRSSSNFGKMQTKRRKVYRNTVIVNNL